MSIFSDRDVGNANDSPINVASGWREGDWTMMYCGFRRESEAMAWGSRVSVAENSSFWHYRLH